MKLHFAFNKTPNKVNFIPPKTHIDSILMMPRNYVYE